MEKASNIFLVIVLACVLIKLVFRAIKRTLKGIRLPFFYSLFILLLPCVGIYSGIILINYDFLIQQEKIFVLVKLLIIDILLIYVDRYVERLWKDRNNLYFQLMHAEYCQEETKAVREQIISVKMIKHDLKNHFISLQALLCRDKIEEAKQYLNHFVKIRFGDAHSITGNPAFDLILSAKDNEANSLGIQVEFEAVIPNYLPVDSIDLTTIIGNAMDNAIRAAAEVEKKRRIITVSLKFQHNCLIMKIKNPYNGNLKKIAQHIITTKQDKESHGIGLYSLKKTTQKYNGYINTNSKDHYFELTVILCVNISNSIKDN